MKNETRVYGAVVGYLLSMISFILALVFSFIESTNANILLAIGGIILTITSIYVIVINSKNKNSF